MNTTTRYFIAGFIGLICIVMSNLQPNIRLIICVVIVSICAILLSATALALVVIRITNAIRERKQIK